MQKCEISLAGAIHEAAEDEWDKAIELWFYDHPTGFSSHVLQVLEDNAVPAYRELLEVGAWGPGNCDEATQVWKRIFDREGVRSEIVNGFYAPRHKAGQSHMSSAEHVWMEVEGGVFDPTAGQFAGNTAMKNYWWDDSTRAYGPSAGPKPVYEARVVESAMDTNPRIEKIIQKDIDKLIRVYSSITDEDVEALEASGFFSIVKTGGRYTSSVPYSNMLDAIEGSYDNMFQVKPLIAAFRSNEMTDVETLEGQLVLWAKKNIEDALDYLDIAISALVALLRIARKHYQLLLSKSEADLDDPLGRIAFAPSRKGAPYEPDTSLEKKLGKAIENHFEGINMLSPEMAQLIRDLMSQGLYPSMFAEPTAGIVYRGMSLEGRGVAWLKKMAGGELIGKKGMLNVSMNYKPRRGAASWTTSKKVAEGFFELGAEYHIILYARVEDNPGMFLSAEKGLYKTDFAERFVDEREAIGLGTIRVFKIEWFSNE